MSSDKDKIKKWKATFKANLSIFSKDLQKIGQACSSSGQSIIFNKWRNPGQKDSEKIQMLTDLKEFNDKYPKGIKGYCKKVQMLLKKRKKNPFKLYIPIYY